MKRVSVFDIMLSDFKAVLSVVGQVLILTTAIISVFSLGALLAYLLVGQFEEGVSFFKASMWLEGSTLPLAVRSSFGFLNWLMLTTLTLWVLLGSTRNYVISIRDRRRSTVLSSRFSVHHRPGGFTDGWSKAGNSN